jgi:gamma-glutamyltranspeptidase/glutathione hydrolase
VTGFDTWTSHVGPTVQVEGNAPQEWAAALAARGHRTETTLPYDSSYGHAHAIVRDEQGFWSGGADPRARVGAAGGG